MDFEKGKAVVGFPFQMIDTSGADVTTGTVNGFITKEGGTQESLSMVPVHEGNGQWSVNLSAAEMNADILGLVFTHTSAVTQQFTIKTIVQLTNETIEWVPATAVGVRTVDDLTWYFYGSIARADTYFSKRLNTGTWDRSTSNDKESALIMSAAAIDKLNFAGSKNDSTQSLQFPRNDDTDVPVEIEYAAYEVAIALLDGYDKDQEIETLGVLSEAYSGVRTTYDIHYVNEHKRAGIPSSEAWDYLKPFLRDPTQLKVSRVS